MNNNEINSIVYPRIHSPLPRNKPQSPGNISGKVRKSYTLNRKLEIIKYYYDNQCNKSLVERNLGVSLVKPNGLNWKIVFV